MALENAKREEEISELKAKFEKEKTELKAKMEREKDELLKKLTNENEDLKSRLECETKGLKNSIENNLYDSNRRLNDLTTKLKSLDKESTSMLDEVKCNFDEEIKWIRDALSKPMSVYFNAYRNDDYLDGGEEYLTFSGDMSSYLKFV